MLTTLKDIPHKNPTTSIIGQIRILARTQLATAEDLLRFEGDPAPVINCKNGELWIADDGSVALRAHGANSYLRHCLDVAYDANAKCPLYDRTVLEIFAKSNDPQELVRHWDEFMGHVIRALAGLRQVIARGHKFKKLSEAKPQTGEHKFGATFNFKNRALPVLLCNGIPSLADLSYGMLRRLMVIPFERTFTPEEDDINRFKEIWASELPGILNRALAGLRQVIARGHKFKYPESVKRATEEFIRHANPLPAFIADCCEREPKARCLMRDFYAAYCRWCDGQGITMTQQQSTVRRNLAHLGLVVKHGNRGDTIRGLRLKSSFEQS